MCIISLKLHNDHYKIGIIFLVIFQIGKLVEVVVQYNTDINGQSRN